MNNEVLKKRTILVIIVTLFMMVAEIYYGIVTHSMALTADGFHMGTHALAFGITLFVCMFAIKYKDKTEKFNAIGGYTSSILLGLTGLAIICESISRFFNPLSIGFEDAIFVAILGLIVNLLCMLIMKGENPFHNHACACLHEHVHEHENLNFKAAYLHIAADALTSVLAIGALLLGKYFGWNILDPLIGVVGGIIIIKWAYGLLVSSCKILLDFN
ncbi:cation transporter [bacterium]|nr:cation transporter [bacterium]